MVSRSIFYILFKFYLINDVRIDNFCAYNSHLFHQFYVLCQVYMANYYFEILLLCLYFVTVIHKEKKIYADEK